LSKRKTLYPVEKTNPNALPPAALQKKSHAARISPIPQLKFGLGSVNLANANYMYENNVEMRTQM
jgi:hypothetical protein